MSSDVVFCGTFSSPGSSQSCPRSRSGSYIGSGNSGAAITSWSGSVGDQTIPGAVRRRAATLRSIVIAG
jgi:hypothetical protein